MFGHHSPHIFRWPQDKKAMFAATELSGWLKIQEQKPRSFNNFITEGPPLSVLPSTKSISRKDNSATSHPTPLFTSSEAPPSRIRGYHHHLCHPMKWVSVACSRQMEVASILEADVAMVKFQWCGLIQIQPCAVFHLWRTPLFRRQAQCRGRWQMWCFISFADKQSSTIWT